jgi:hypothetical protein
VSIRNGYKSENYNHKLKVRNNVVNFYLWFCFTFFGQDDGGKGQMWREKGGGGGKIIKYYDCNSPNFSCHYTRLKRVINYQSNPSVALRLACSLENRFILEIFRDVQS